MDELYPNIYAFHVSGRYYYLSLKSTPQDRLVKRHRDVNGGSKNESEVKKYL